jgi:hypothetical protein
VHVNQGHRRWRCCIDQLLVNALNATRYVDWQAGVEHGKDRDALAPIVDELINLGCERVACAGSSG